MKYNQREYPYKMTMDREVSQEKRMRRMGQERAQRNANKAAATTTSSQVGGGLGLLKRVVIPLAEGITEYLAEVQGGGASTRTVAAPLLCQVEASTAAYLAASAVINRFGGPRGGTSLASVAGVIGRRMEDEVRFGALQKAYPGLYATLQSSFKANHTVSEKYRTRVLSRYAKLNRLSHDGWTPTQIQHLGLKMVELLIQHTGIVTIETVWSSPGTRRARSTNFIEPTQEALDIIADVHAQLAAKPVYLPTVVEPKPWATPERGSGGYHFLDRPLVKNYSRAFQEELANTEMPDVLRAVNSMQSTAWRVNPKVLETALAIWESPVDREYQGADGRIHAPLRPRSVPEEMPPMRECPTEEELRAAKRVRSSIHARNLERKRDTIAAALTITAAIEYAEYDAFYFPMQLDFRGRCYTMPSGLSPQGDDLAKGLLTFADAIPLGESGVEWLAIHGANSWGIDKVPFEERIAWVSEHERMILNCADEPLENREWMAADSPFVFLAFCFEWATACSWDEGFEAYPCSLPVGVDGSCNGLQHFSAMLRDPVGGAAVNLVPDTAPHDVYGEVLAAVVLRLHGALRVCDTGDMAAAAQARAWLGSGLLVRDLVKRPTMTLPYGCTRKGIEAQIMDDVVRPAIVAGHVIFPDDASGWKHVSFLAGVVWDAMGEVVVAARDAMAWLQTAADAVSEKTGGPMVWRTPAGFPVRHFEVRSRVFTVRTAIGGKRLEVTLREPTDKINKGRMRLGVSPHFVHALDATHLYLTVCDAVDSGIESFAMIHDSYGTHAANVAQLGRILRTNFVRLYTESNPLEELAATLAAQGIEVPPPPLRGALDINAVLDSPFFFA